MSVALNSCAVLLELVFYFNPYANPGSSSTLSVRGEYFFTGVWRQALRSRKLFQRAYKFLDWPLLFAYKLIQISFPLDLSLSASVSQILRC